ISEQKFHDHAARFHCTLGCCLHHHIRRRLADAGGSHYALTLDFDHTGAAVTVSAVAWLRQPAQMRDLDAFAFGDLPDGFAGPGRHHSAVEVEVKLVSHETFLSH